MKLPSIQQVARESIVAVRRFPLVLIAAVAATVSALMIVDYEGPPTTSILFKILFASILGFPLLLASALVAERREWPKSMAWGVPVICVVLLAAYALTVPASIPTAPQLHLLRLLILFLAFCLLVATAPYAQVKQLNGFWQYNRCLVQRILLAGLFSLTLYLGLALALAAVDQLFGIDVPERRYGELALVILGVFATWFFLVGVSKDLDALETLTDYPRVLKVFGQYILSPLLVVYLVILYAYIVKIIVEWSWPRGMVSGLIFGFASTGIVAYLLLHPIRHERENRWITVAARWFWIAMIPMIVVLELAIWRRVSEYGITENRYFALVLGGWLAAMVVYFLAAKTKSIKVVPASIGVLALLVSFGPWGVFRISERSQVGRLEKLLTQNNLLIKGKVQKAQTAIAQADAAQISSVVRYLQQNHGYAQIQPWFSQSLKRDSAGIGLIDQPPANVVAYLGVEYSEAPIFWGGRSRRLRANMKQALSIGEYDHLMVVQRLGALTPDTTHVEEGVTCVIDSSLEVITARLVDGGAIVDSVQIRLRPLVDSLLREYGALGRDDIPVERMSVEAATAAMKLRVVLLSIEVRRDGDDLKPIAYDALTLYSRTRQ
ncbi:MAG: DUF4153 domain-containing protein [Candidatus Zixiibacteriota bacterium]